MSLPEQYETTAASEEDLHAEKNYDTREEQLALENLLKLSESLKTDLEDNLNKFKEETIQTINETSDMNCCTSSMPYNKSDEVINNWVAEKRSLDKHEENVDVSFWKESHKTFSALQQELKNVQNKMNEFKPQQLLLEKEEFCNCVSFVRDKIGELHETYLNRTYDEKSNYLKKISDVENKCQHWMNKYNELRDEYLRLESKCANVEQENCSYQIEISRIKMIEDENSRLNQAMDKSNIVRKQLESALESCHESVSKHQTDVELARNKVREAVETVEKTCSEKERLTADLNKSNEEIIRLENDLKNLIQEAGIKVNSEVEKVKTMYKNKLRDANVKIELLNEENRIASNKIQQMSKDYEILNEKLKSINHKYTKESDMCSKKTALLVHQIKEHEVVFDGLTSDIEILKETNMKLQESYARKKKKYLMEIDFLTDMTKSLETHLNKALNQIAEDNVRIVEATDKIKTLEMEISKIKQPTDTIEQKNMQIEELLKQIGAHQRVVDMWRTEMRDMIEKFKHKIDQLKQNYSKLYQMNIKLKRMINNSKINHFLKRKISKSRKNKITNFSTISTST